MENQPAIKSYVFEKGYKDLWNTIQDSWKANLAEANQHLSQFETTVTGAFHLGVGISIIVFGSIFFGMISLLHVSLMLIFASIIYLAFSIIWGADKLYRSINKIFTACPHPGCYHKFDIPVYHCPNCNSPHTRLHPGPYGILSRTCKCGAKLPQTFFNGRKKLAASCPNSTCGLPIDTKESRPIVIPIIGAPSVGKTCFATSFVYYMKEELGTTEETQFEFTSEVSSLTYEHNLASFKNGGAPLKTVEAHPSAINIFLQLKHQKIRRILYLFDPAGEAYLDTSNTQTHRFYDYFHGAFFLIDPFSIPTFYQEYAEKIAINDVKPSAEHLEDVYDRVIINLEKNYGIKPDQKIKAPLAIVFTKVDVADLEDKFGETAGRIIQESDSSKFKSLDDGINEACRNFLMDYEMAPILNKFESKFKNFRFFSVSSKGANSVRIKAPTKWLLEQIDASFKKIDQD